MTEAALLEPPTTTTVTGPLADLILVRLLPPSKSRPTPRKLRDDVGLLFRQSPALERVEATLTALRSAGLVTAKGRQLTEEGRQRALAYLGIAELPARCDWRAIKAKYLVPKALGLSPSATEIGSKDKLAALLLKRKLQLPAGTPTTLNGVFQAIVCEKLGYPNLTKLNDLLPVVLSQKLESDRVLTAKELIAAAPHTLLQATRPGFDGLRAVALAGLVEDIEPPQQTEEFDLEAFAHTVTAAARTCPSGWFGHNKVFINHVWRQLQDEPRFAPLGLPGFKQKLIEANQQRLLTLSRADLVQNMPADDVRESETTHLNAVFHFILIEKE